MYVYVLHVEASGRELLVEVESLAGGEARLLRVLEPQELLPQVEHLLDAVFPDIQGLHNSLRAALMDVGDTLDNVHLSVAAYHQWQSIAISAAQKAVAMGIDPETIPDEMAKAEPDGSLLIWVDAPRLGRVEMRISREHWRWRKAQC